MKKFCCGLLGLVAIGGGVVLGFGLLIKACSLVGPRTPFEESTERADDYLNSAKHHEREGRLVLAAVTAGRAEWSLELAYSRKKPGYQGPGRKQKDQAVRDYVAAIESKVVPHCRERERLARERLAADDVEGAHAALEEILAGARHEAFRFECAFLAPTCKALVEARSAEHAAAAEAERPALAERLADLMRGVNGLKVGLDYSAEIEALQPPKAPAEAVAPDPETPAEEPSPPTAPAK